MAFKSTLLKSGLMALAVVAAMGAVSPGARADADDWRWGGYHHRQWERQEAREEARERYEAALRREAWLRHEWWEHHRRDVDYRYGYRVAPQEYGGQWYR